MYMYTHYFTFAVLRTQTKILMKTKNLVETHGKFFDVFWRLWRKTTCLYTSEAIPGL